jgi:DNA-directed RNA polymerase subunit RPC12/RpoP
LLTAQIVGTVNGRDLETVDSLHGLMIHSQMKMLPFIGKYEMFPRSMSEFKYACPVCGQHIKCDSSQVGTIMECPTCFQRITVPQAPSTDDPKFIIAGIKVGERPAPNVPDATPMGTLPPAKGFSGAIMVVVILIAIGAAVAFVYRGTIFKSLNMPVTTTNAAPEQNTYTPPPLPVVVVPTNLPVPTGTNYWTMNVKALGTPDVPAGGKIHGRYFTAGRMILNSDGLTIRTADLPPEAGVTIYLRPNPIDSLFGKSLLFEPDTPGAPTAFLRWKEQGREANQGENQYALRLEFGQPTGNTISGKIYLCTPDDLKSYVVGVFNAEIVRPTPQ